MTVWSAGENARRAITPAAQSKDVDMSAQKQPATEGEGSAALVKDTTHISEDGSEVELAIDKLAAQKLAAAKYITERDPYVASAVENWIIIIIGYRRQVES